ncbi:MAG: ATP-binding cassette domain-containing protein [Proteobacteria bacterium]|nr:ATP-binding cassette domain-containing protein [Pseudomonadota bacterium]
MKDDHDPRPPPVLEARGLVVRYGGVCAVDGVSLAVAAGEVVGLVGPNGAGKSSLFDALAGDRRPDSGEIRLGGTRIEHEGAEARLGRGMGRTFQVPRPIGSLSVLENVMLAAPGQAGEGVLASLCAPARVRAAERRLAARAAELLDDVGLDGHADANAAHLSVGQRKLLDLARLLMAEPRVLLLDEPMAGVHPATAERLGERLTALAADGRAVLFVEHQLGLVAARCTRVIAMAAGRIACEGPPAEVLADPRLAAAYLGRTA